jgi:hypothetical protein
MKQTAVEILENKVEAEAIALLDGELTFNEFMDNISKYFNQAKEMEKEHELKTKIICWKEALQFINDNYMVELINIRIYNMEVELLTFKSE